MTVMVGDYLVGPDAPYAGNVNTSFTDNTPLWNAIMAAAQPGETIIIPPGYCGFASKPNPIPDYVKVVGSGSVSGLVKSYAPASNDEFFITTGASYCTVENLFLMQATGYQTGTAIGRVAANTSDASYRTILRNVFVTFFGTGMWYGAININGAAGAANYGTRAHVIDNCVLKASCYGLLLIAANACQAPGLVVAMKDASGVGLWVIGVTNNPSTNFYADGPLQCHIRLGGVHSSVINGAAASVVEIDSACVGVTVNAAYLGSTPTMAGSNNHVFANGARWDV